ncbi:MAG: carbamate kinase [Armatimonadota bacterium]|nr:carbamate kinase [Armatimonadota bacterium]MDR7562758.1 carbamate kinase [Armatimonadota bacterium]MDR7568734.1 carbamate kinase [Armatimonadota bacterium]MDR7601084.1 carbamate kinase [Armatimonadota bacterium]
MAGFALVALGGNALLRGEGDVSVEAERRTLRGTAEQVVALTAQGWKLLLTHGNGPQVGFDLLRAEVAARAGGFPRIPLDVLGAQTQGSIGYLIAEALERAFQRPGSRRPVAVVVTRVVVDPRDPAFTHPTKPVGPYYSEEEALSLREREGWVVVRQERGWRRVVPSPEPLEVVDLDAIRLLLQEGYLVIAAGGGGIPVVREPDGSLRGVEAVVDKDLTSALLASAFSCDLFLLSTDVPGVALHYRKPGERWLDWLTASEARRYLAEGHFPPGSMGPKIEATLRYLEAGGKEAVITATEEVVRAVRGEAGTHIVPDP